MGCALSSNQSYFGLPSAFLHSDLNFLRALPCKPLALACSVHDLEIALLILAHLRCRGSLARRGRSRVLRRDASGANKENQKRAYKRSHRRVPSQMFGLANLISGPKACCVRYITAARLEFNSARYWHYSLGSPCSDQRSFPHLLVRRHGRLVGDSGAIRISLARARRPMRRDDH